MHQCINSVINTFCETFKEIEFTEKLSAKFINFYNILRNALTGQEHPKIQY